MTKLYSVTTVPAGKVRGILDEMSVLSNLFQTVEEALTAYVGEWNASMASPGGGTEDDPDPVMSVEELTDKEVTGYREEEPETNEILYAVYFDEMSDCYVILNGFSI